VEGFLARGGGSLVSVARGAGVLSAEERPRASSSTVSAHARGTHVVRCSRSSIVDGRCSAGPRAVALQHRHAYPVALWAVPLFFFTEASFDRRVRQAVRSDRAARGWRRHGSSSVEDACGRARWWRDAWFTEEALLAITIAFLVNGIRSDVGGELSTWRTAGGHRTLAGWWYGRRRLHSSSSVWRWVRAAVDLVAVALAHRRLDLR